MHIIVLRPLMQLLVLFVPYFIRYTNGISYNTKQMDLRINLELKSNTYLIPDLEIWCKGRVNDS